MADRSDEGRTGADTAHRGRGTADVITDHLERRRNADLEGDLATNDGVRELAKILSDPLSAGSRSARCADPPHAWLTPTRPGSTPNDSPVGDSPAGAGES